MSKRLVAGFTGLLLLSGYALAPSPTRADDEKELVFAGFGGTLGDAFKSTVIPAFEKAHNIKITFLTQETVPMLAKIKAEANKPEIDVVAGTDASHFAGIQYGVFDKLDPSQYQNAANLYGFAKPDNDIGFMFGIQSLGIEYNTKVFKEKGWAPPNSWYDLWDPKYKGHVVVYNLPAGYAATFLGMLAVLEGGSPANTQPAFDKLPSLVPQALAFVDPSAQLDSLFATGGGWIAYNGSGRVGALAATGVPVALAIPKEGGVLNPLWLDIVKNAPHPTLAKEFVDYMLSPDAQVMIAKSMMFGPVNTKTVLSGADAAAVPYGADQVKQLKVIDNNPINQNLGPLVQKWNQVIARK